MVCPSKGSGLLEYSLYAILVAIVVCSSLAGLGGILRKTFVDDASALNSMNTFQNNMLLAPPKVLPKLHSLANQHTLTGSADDTVNNSTSSNTPVIDVVGSNGNTNYSDTKISSQSQKSQSHVQRTIGNLPRCEYAQQGNRLVYVCP